jgi:hypothetical protein
MNGNITSQQSAAGSTREPNAFTRIKSFSHIDPRLFGCGDEKISLCVDTLSPRSSLAEHLGFLVELLAFGEDAIKAQLQGDTKPRGIDFFPQSAATLLSIIVTGVQDQGRFSLDPEQQDIASQVRGALERQDIVSFIVLMNPHGLLASELDIEFWKDHFPIRQRLLS